MAGVLLLIIIIIKWLFLASLSLSVVKTYEFVNLFKVWSYILKININGRLKRVKLIKLLNMNLINKFIKYIKDSFNISSIKTKFLEFINFLINFIKKVLILKLFLYKNNFMNSLYSRLNKFKMLLYRFFFGERPGTYIFDNQVYLAFPQIILNDKVLLEFRTANNDKIQRFLWEMFKDFDYWDKEKEVRFESKLMELLEGKSFPLESPFFSQKESKPINFSFPLGTFADKMFYPTNLLEKGDFTLKLYEEWKKEPEFLTYVICYYFAHYIIAVDNFDIDEIRDVNLRNKLLTLDLSPFFIYKEQVESVAKDLLNMFREELEESFIKRYTFSFWLDILINNLFLVNLPFETINFKKEGFLNKKSLKNMIKKWFFIYLILISPLFPIFLDFFCFFMFTKYSTLIITFIVFFIYKKLEKVIKEEGSIVIDFNKIYEFLKRNLKNIIMSFFLALVSPLFPYLKKYKKNICCVLNMFPLISVQKTQEQQILLFKKRKINSIKNLLIGQYMNNPNIFFKQQQNFNLTKEKFFESLGILLEKTRLETPRSTNHLYLNQYKIIFDLKTKNINDQRIILERLKHMMINGISKTIFNNETPLSPEEEEKIIKEWLLKMMDDPDRPKSSLKIGSDIFSSLMLKDNKNLTLEKGKKINFIYDIKIPSLSQSGDIEILENLEEKGQKSNFYDFKSGDKYFYSTDKSYEEMNEDLNNLTFRNKRVKNLKIVIQTPITVPEDELKMVIYENKRNRYGKNIVILNPYESETVQNLIKKEKENDVIRVIEIQADIISKELDQDNKISSEDDLNKLKNLNCDVKDIRKKKFDKNDSSEISENEKNQDFDF